MSELHSILTVDDSPAIHEDFRKLFAALAKPPVDDLESALFGDPAPRHRIESFRFDSALQGEEALEKVRAAVAAGRPYSLAFVDGRMPPGWDGLETIERLWEVDPDLQVVMCTAYSDYSWEDMRRRLGHSDNLLVLKKPFDSVEVLQIAHALTRKWDLARAVRSTVEELDRKVHERTAALEREMAERSRTEADLRQVQKIEAVGQLAAGIAHDFNNLMTVIQGNVELVLMDLQDDTVKAESLQQVLSAASRASTLTRQLLVFSRKQVTRPRPVDLNQILADAVTLLRRLLGENIELRVQASPEAAALLADECNLSQVIINLSVNARDAMPEGGVLSFETALETVTEAAPGKSPFARSGRFVTLSVADTGCGMDAETLSHIFEPFFTTKEVGKGTGIGLATVYGIVRQHEGWIEVESQPGRGSVFKLFLPQYEGDLKPNQSPGADSEKVTLPPEPSTILVVEDEPGVREFVKLVLARNSFRVLEAVDGIDALRVWAQHAGEVDLLFTDMVMPNGLSGRGLAERLRGESADLKVVITSGYSPEALGAQKPGGPDFDFLPKPFTAAALLRALGGALKPFSDRAEDCPSALLQPAG